MIVDDIGILVFAHDQVAVGRNREVVAIIELVFPLALEEQLDHVRPATATGDELEDLPQPLLSAVGRADVDCVGAHVDAFAARNRCRAQGDGARAQVVLRGLDIVELDPPHLVQCAHRHDRRIPVARIGDPLDDHRLQCAPGAQIAPFFRNEPIEDTVFAIFGQVDDARGGIDAGGLVVEAAHGGQRHGIDLSGRGSRDFEHPTMRF